MRVSVLQFPGTHSDRDCLHALRHLGHEARLLWHKETKLNATDAVILPGGFAYGDYLRAGAIARLSPIMRAVSAFAREGGLVLGICNGFQILCEARLLPGALIQNRELLFRCEDVFLKVMHRQSPFTCAVESDILRLPIAHGEGCYFVDEATLLQMQSRRQVLWQYCDEAGEINDAANPNGSIHNIAGVCNERGNVAGLMPHPERACEILLGNEHGKGIFTSMAQAILQPKSQTDSQRI